MNACLVACGARLQELIAIPMPPKDASELKNKVKKFAVNPHGSILSNRT